MKKLLAFAVILYSVAACATPEYQEDENRMCAYIVGIPYASDNFTDEEWERFKICKKFIQLN